MFSERLRRKDSFLGIHFDFHAKEDCTQIGKYVTHRMITDLIDQVKPDYIQCDCKGHPGFSSYPTKVGTPPPGFVKDQLRIWREVTARHGVALYLHYSGVIDKQAIKRHPSWARVDEKGKKDKANTSVFGPYVDKLLIPQLKELNDVYQIDGVWLDGECWATCQDYGKKVIKAFQKKISIKNIPRKPDDPYFFEFTEFCREGFRKYLNHYVTALHRHNPKLQICSNWAYTSYMPEPVNIDVDFLSGDYPMTDSINAARLEARCLVHQGKSWDLMAWAFCSRWEELHKFSMKSPVQLQQEAAIVISLGGGFQAYFQQKRDGSICPWQIKLMSETAKFCRKRQKLCHKAKPIPQIALLFSGYAYYRKIDRLFSPWTSKDKNSVQTGSIGILKALLESQNVVDVVAEHQLNHRMSEYPLIVIPEWECLDPKFRNKLLKYIKTGGNLLLIGPLMASVFKRQLGVQFVGKPEVKANWLQHDDRIACLFTLSQHVIPNKNTKTFGKLYAEHDITGPSMPAATITNYGKGKIAAMYVNFGERYCKAATPTARKFLHALVRQLFIKPIVEVDGSQYVDITLNGLNGKLMINMINTSGPHGDENIYVYDEIVPVGPLAVTIRYGKKTKSIMLEPEHIPLEYKFNKGEIRLTLPRLEIHEIIVLE